MLCGMILNLVKLQMAKQKGISASPFLIKLRMKINYTLCTIILLLLSIKATAQVYQVSGRVKEYATLDDLPFVTVKNKSTKQGAETNKQGFFSIKAQIKDTLEFSFVGYETTRLVINEIKNDIQVVMKKTAIELNEVTIMADKPTMIHANQTGFFRINAKQIKEMPMLLGEKDPMRALQLLPGIQEAKEGSSGLTVRGGSTGQNLLILDEATVYNANHLFGFFSTFNTDALKNVTAYKSAFPATYGGRVSSIIDFQMKEGNIKKMSVEGGIGLISSRLLVEGPILKNKISYLLSARRTYADYLIKPFQSDRERTSYYFYDFTGKLKFDFNPKNQFFMSSYLGKDSFKQENIIPRSNGSQIIGNLLNGTNLDWANFTFTSRWNHIINSKMFLNTSLIHSEYGMNYGLYTRQDYLVPPRFEQVKYGSSLTSSSLKADLDYYAVINFKLGIQFTRFNFQPRNFSYQSHRITDDFEDNAKKSDANELVLYGQLQKNIGKIELSSGIRAVIFNATHKALEPRFLLRLPTKKIGNFTFSYDRMNQFLHLVSNTGNGLPTDTWIPSSDELKPVKADHLNLNYSKSLGKTWILGADVYYKWLFNNTDFRQDAQFISLFQSNVSTESFQWEKNLTQGRGWNYGYELFLQKYSGKFTGHIGYTLSWSISKNEELNQGVPFYTSFDRRHVFEGVVSYRVKPKLRLASTFIYTSGMPISLGQQVFFRTSQGTNFLEYIPSFNNFRMAPYHRLDLAAELNTRRDNSWEISIYNAYNRKNPYNYDLLGRFNREDKTMMVVNKRQWLLPILPSVTYNFKIK